MVFTVYNTLLIKALSRLLLNDFMISYTIYRERYCIDFKDWAYFGLLEQAIASVLKFTVAAI